VRLTIIGLSGVAGAGKSFAALHLTERRGFRRIRFAEPLKAMLRTLGCSNEELDGAAKEAPCPALCGRTPREAMQTLGTEWGRQLIHPDLWLEAWRRRVAAVAEFAPAAQIVVDDVRFLNEAEAIWRLGGMIWRIDREGARGGAPAHVSEAMPFGCDRRVWNAGEADAFRAALDAAIEAI
jgi:hypothetical protein